MTLVLDNNSDNKQELLNEGEVHESEETHYLNYDYDIIKHDLNFLCSHYVQVIRGPAL